MRQCTDKPTCKGISGTVCVDNLFVLKCIDGIGLGFIKFTGGDGNSWLSTISEYDNTVASRVRFWFLSESLGDGGKVLRIRNAVRASPSLCFCLVTNEVVDVWEYFLKLSTVKLGNEGSREVEDEDLAKPPISAHTRRNHFQTVIPFHFPKPSC